MTVVVGACDRPAVTVTADDCDGVADLLAVPVPVGVTEIFIIFGVGVAEGRGAQP